MLDDDDVLAYQFMAGIGYDLSDRTNIFSEYRYFAADGVDVTTSAATGSVATDIDYASSQFRFGVRIGL